MIDLLVFNDFWVNCWFNSNFSILTSVNRSYVDAAYMNSYTYITEDYQTPTGTDLRILKLGFTDEVEKVVLSAVNLTPIMLEDTERISNQIITMLKTNYLYVGVDLYEWIPNSICWQKYHWEHYTLVKGYDESSDSFIVFDENYNGYGAHLIPRLRFEKAITASPFEIDAFLIDFKGDVCDYTICTDDVRKNADRISNELDNSRAEHWQLSKKDISEGHMLDLFSLYSFGISNRQIANGLLVYKLKSYGALSTDEYRLLASIFKELSDGWEKIKNSFMKANLSSPRRLDCIKINDYKNTLIENEIKAWTLLTKFLRLTIYGQSSTGWHKVL